MARDPLKPAFSFAFGQRVRVLSPHPDAGATGEVLNAWLFPDGTEIVFAFVPGGEGRYQARDLESVAEKG